MVRFDPRARDQDFKSLAAGTKDQVEFKYSVDGNDPNGGDQTATVTTATVAIDVIGINDAPDAQSDTIMLDELAPDDPLPVLDNDEDPDTEPDSGEKEKLTISGLEAPDGTTLGLDDLSAGVNRRLGLENGSITASGGEITYMADDDFVGVETFDYVVTDGNGEANSTDRATVTLIVGDVEGRPPVIENPTPAEPDVSERVEGASDEGSAALRVGGDATFSDPNPGDATASATQGAFGTFTVPSSVSPGSFEWSFTVPDAEIEFLGERDEPLRQEHTITVRDGTGFSDSKDVEITITGKNDRPDAGDDSVATRKDTAVGIDVLDNDTDIDRGDTLSIARVVVPPVNGSAAPAPEDGRIVYTPDPGFTGIDSFDYIVTDDSGTGSATDTATVTVVVGEEDRPPEVDRDDEEQARRIVEIVDGAPGEDSDTLGTGGSIRFTDPNPHVEAHDVEATQGPFGSFGVPATANPGSFDWSFSVDDAALAFLAEGEERLQEHAVVITDPTGLSDTAIVSIRLIGSNDRPEARNDLARIALEPRDGQPVPATPVSIPVLENDTDIDFTDALTIGPIEDPANGTAVADGDSIVYTPDPGFRGIETFEYTVNDGSGTSSATDTALVTVIVGEDIRRPPVIDENELPAGPVPVVELPEGDQDEGSGFVGAAGELRFTDADGHANAHEVRATQGAFGSFSVPDESFPENVDWSFSVADSELEFLAEGETKIQEHAVTVTDPTGLSDTATIPIALTGRNDAPEVGREIRDRVITVLELDDDTTGFELEPTVLVRQGIRNDGEVVTDRSILIEDLIFTRRDFGDRDWEIVGSSTVSETFKRSLSGIFEDVAVRHRLGSHPSNRTVGVQR